MGEVGLDASPRFYKSFANQKEVFRQILRACAKSGDKILSVHSVRTAKVVLDMIEAELPRAESQVVLHWFTGDRTQMKRAVDLGCYFSINVAMLTNQKKVDMVADMPMDRIVTETDGPFAQTGNRPSVSSDVRVVVDQLADLHDVTKTEMTVTILKNMHRLEQ